MIYMGFLNGSIALRKDSVVTLLSPQETHPDPFQMSWINVIAPHVIVKERPERANSVQKYIYFLASGTLTVNKSSLTILNDEDLERQVIETVTQEMGLPVLVADIAQKFRAIPEVEKVRVKVDEDGPIFVLLVLVHMPQYNYELMKRLVDLEIDSYRLAKRHGYELEYKFLPSPYVDVSNMETEDPELYLD